jgi:maltose O-acetyltransferase
MDRLAPTPVLPADDAAPASTRRRLIRLLRGELSGLRPRLLLVQLLVTPLPRLSFTWLRTACYRWLAGIHIGRRTRILGKIDLEGSGEVVQNLRVGEGCVLNAPLHLNASAPITIGNRVGIGHHVVIITDSHRLGDASQRLGERLGRPVTIEDGVWIAARVTVLPGVTIGRGSAVAAGAVVTRDVPPNCLVAGVPARVLRELPP